MSAAASSTCSVCSNTSRWWNGLCSTPRMAAASGRTTSSTPMRSSRRIAGLGVVGLEQPPDLGEDALAARPVGQVRVAAGEPLGLGVDGEPELVREPHQAQQPQRIVAEHLLGDRPQPPRLEVGAAAVRVEQVAARKRHRHRVDREVAPAEVVGHGSAAGGDVDRVAVAHHPPGAVPLREREGGAAVAARERAGGGWPGRARRPGRRRPPARPSSRSRTLPPDEPRIRDGREGAHGVKARQRHAPPAAGAAPAT